jgi:hypothetical protein
MKQKHKPKNKKTSLTELKRSVGKGKYQDKQTVKKEKR